MSSDPAVQGVMLTITRSLVPTPSERASPMCPCLLAEGYSSLRLYLKDIEPVKWTTSEMSVRLGLPLQVVQLPFVSKMVDGAIDFDFECEKPVNAAACCLMANVNQGPEFGKASKVMVGDVAVMRKDGLDLHPGQVAIMCDYIGAMVGSFKDTLNRWASERLNDGQQINIIDSAQGLLTMFGKEEFGKWFDTVKVHRARKGDGEDWADLPNPVL